MMRIVPLIALLALTAGCGRTEAPAEAPVTAAATPPVSDAVATTPAVLTPVDLRRVCRAGLAAIHGQEIAAIELTGEAGGIIDAQWRAPVDGGIMRAQCRAGDGLVVWKPLDLPDPVSVRWMNEAADPVVRYALRGDEITITQTLPDSTTETAVLTVPVSGAAG
ncbi:hypothetical protein [Brevundimonas sp. R86498]|uniref:hypothetical protein n=1 Tax=Brevundimonas sp. R86498 TaxID=3093845 RepID=UPI0037CC7B6F